MSRRGHRRLRGLDHDPDDPCLRLLRSRRAGSPSTPSSCRGTAANGRRGPPGFPRLIPHPAHGVSPVITIALRLSRTTSAAAFSRSIVSTLSTMAARVLSRTDRRKRASSNGIASLSGASSEQGAVRSLFHACAYYLIQ